MILEQEEPVTYYHGSDKSLEPGTVLRPSGEPTPHYKREKFLEMMRPKNMLSRTRCIYMVTKPRDVQEAIGFSVNHIYEVNPGNIIERSSLYWFDLLSGVDELDDDDFSFIDMYNQFEYLRNYARNYWNGAAPPERAVWEYRTETATISTDDY